MKRDFRKVLAFVLAIVGIFSSIATVFAESEKPSSMTAYTGEAITPDIMAYSGETQLVNGTDYDLSYENNINVGTATVIITFKGNYKGTRNINFDIVARTLSDNDVTFLPIDNQVFTGSEIKPEPTITYGDITLVKDTDYTLSYENNINVGVGKVNVSFIGNYEGTASTTFKILADELNTENISFSTIENLTYTGSELTPEPIITYNGITLEKDKDYSLSYENNINAGTATINIEFTGNYTGKTVTTFDIIQKSADESTITISDIPDQTYTGVAITPEPIVKDITK